MTSCHCGGIKRLHNVVDIYLFGEVWGRLYDVAKRFLTGGVRVTWRTHLYKRTIRPILDIVFGISVMIMFAEFIIVLWGAFSLNFTNGVIVQPIMPAFIFAMCLDWTAGFSFFKGTIAPIV